MSVCLSVCLIILKASLQTNPDDICNFPSNWQKMRVSETSQNQPPNVCFFLVLYLLNMHWVFLKFMEHAMLCVVIIIVFTIVYIQPGRLPQYLPGDSSCDTCKMWAQVLKPIFSRNDLLVHVNSNKLYSCACVWWLWVHVHIYTHS